MNKTTHDMYECWRNMKSRCRCKKYPSYDRYGGRGIKVCERWANDFWAFVADMGPRPKGHSIDRINNDGNYEPGNCRWATQSMQARNTSSSVLLEYNGEILCMSDVAAKLGIRPDALHYRIKRNGKKRAVEIGFNKKPKSPPNTGENREEG